MNTSSSNYYVDIYPIDQVPKDLYEIIENDSKEYDPDTFPGNILLHLKDHIYGQNPGSYLVAAYQSTPKIYLGGVVLFLNVKRYPYGVMIDTPSPGFEEIAKSLQGCSVPVKLTSLLIPAMIEFLKPLGFHRVYNFTWTKQGDILRKHYGFKYLRDTPLIKFDETGADIEGYYEESSLLGNNSLLVHEF